MTNRRSEGGGSKTVLEVLPVKVSLAVGAQTNFAAQETDSNGVTTDVTTSATWSSSKPSVATISPSGQVLCIGPGATSIKAVYGKLRGSSRLVVTKVVLQSIAISPQNQTVTVGQQQQFQALGTYADGTTRDITTRVVWSSSSLAATISASGLATAGAAASIAQITASLDGVSSQVLLTITLPTLVGLAITPSNPSIAAGQSQQFRAMGQYSDGSQRDLTASANWSSSPSSVATIALTGLANSIVRGTATITAISGSQPATTMLTVTAPVVTGIVISSKIAYVGAGQTRQFTATATYSDNSAKDVTASTAWTSSNSSVLKIDRASGVATGVSAGTATITGVFNDPNGNPFPAQSLQLTVALNLSDLAKNEVATYCTANRLVQQTLTAFERRGNISDAESAQLNDALERMTRYLNSNPDVPIPNFNAASKVGNSVSDLQLLGIKWNADPTKGTIGTGSGKANVIDDRYRAICSYLYKDMEPPLTINGVTLEHDPGSFPPGSGPYSGLSHEQLQLVAMYGYLQNLNTTAPAYVAVKSNFLQDDGSRSQIFNGMAEAAANNFRTNFDLYVASLARLVQNSQSPQINVSDLSKVVVWLADQGIQPDDPQLNTWIDRALATAQNVGQDRPPSDITINLPDLEKDVSEFEIVKENIFALQPAYFCSMLEELKVFQVVEKLVELFQNGILPVVKGAAGNLLFDWWKNAALRVSESERRSFYARSLGFPGGDADSPNREFRDLFMRFVSAVSSFVRQNTVDNLLRSNIPGAISQQQVRKSARDLATNISAHGYGIAYPMATELQKEINSVMAILRNDEIENAYGAKDMWQLVDQVAGLELGGAKNSVKYRTMASAGATVFAWLAQRATLLASNSYVPILDITQLQLPPSFSTNATTNPSDFDLVGACDQWLAVTGTQEDSVEQAAQPVEAPVMPSRPIQIPSVARDMLESVGIAPAMAYSMNPGKANGKANWRVS